MKRFFCLLGFLLFPSLAHAEAKEEYVLLLHGIKRSKSSMETLAGYLQKHGYHTINVDYPSTSQPIPELANKTLSTALKQVEGKGKTVHFVTHSMGGILLRSYLSAHNIPQLGRVVMLAPPNKGSEVADFLKDYTLFQYMYGPAGQQLGTQKDGFIAGLGKVDFDLGVIAGEDSINPVTSWFLLPGVDDGSVTIEDTKVQGMRDHIILPATHTFIMSNDESMRQTLHFLQHGAFDHARHEN